MGMRDFIDVEFVPAGAELTEKRGTLVVFVGSDLKPGEDALRVLGSAAGVIEAAAAAIQFKGKIRTALDVLAPAGLPYDRLLVVGLDSDKALADQDYITLGGFVAGKLREGSRATVIF